MQWSQSTTGQRHPAISKRSFSFFLLGKGNLHSIVSSFVLVKRVLIKEAYFPANKMNCM